MTTDLNAIVVFLVVLGSIFCIAIGMFCTIVYCSRPTVISLDEYQDQLEEEKRQLLSARQGSRNGELYTPNDTGDVISINIQQPNQSYNEKKKESKKSRKEKNHRRHHHTTNHPTKTNNMIADDRAMIDDLLGIERQNTLERQENEYYYHPNDKYHETARRVHQEFSQHAPSITQRTGDWLSHYDDDDLLDDEDYFGENDDIMPLEERLQLEQRTQRGSRRGGGGRGGGSNTVNPHHLVGIINPHYNLPATTTSHNINNKNINNNGNPILASLHQSHLNTPLQSPIQFVTLHPAAMVGGTTTGVIAATPEQHLQHQRALRQYQYQVALTNPALSAHHNGSVRSGYRYAIPTTSVAAIVAGQKPNENPVSLVLPTSQQIPSNNTSHHNTNNNHHHYHNNNNAIHPSQQQQQQRQQQQQQQQQRRASLIDSNETQSQQHHHHPLKQQQRHDKSDKKTHHRTRRAHSKVSPSQLFLDNEESKYTTHTTDITNNSKTNKNNKKHTPSQSYSIQPPITQVNTPSASTSSMPTCTQTTSTSITNNLQKYQTEQLPKE